jgi:hypothetical protein
LRAISFSSIETSSASEQELVKERAAMATDLATETLIDDELKKLYSEVENYGAFFRKMDRPSRRIAFETGSSTFSVVDRDKAVLALSCKAIRTKAAIRTLAVAGMGDDAMALARVVLENCVILAWMLAEPHGVSRLDTYCLANAAIRTRVEGVIETHYDDNPDLRASVKSVVDGLDRAIADELFNDFYTTWAWFPDEPKSQQPKKISLRQMFLELSNTEPDGIKKSFAYDMVYFQASEFIHSGPSSLTRIGRGLSGRTFALTDNADDYLSSTAMLVGNLATYLVVRLLFGYIGMSDSTDRLDEVWRRLRKIPVGNCEPLTASEE